MPEHGVAWKGCRRVVIPCQFPLRPQRCMDAPNPCPLPLCSLWSEVTRAIVLEDLAPGLHAVSVPKLSKWVDPESLRVKGQGDATILEVCQCGEFSVVGTGAVPGSLVCVACGREA